MLGRGSAGRVLVSGIYNHEFPRRCFVASIDASLKLTSCVSQNLVVGLSLPHSASCSEFALVSELYVAISSENDFELSAPVSSSPVICNKPEFGDDEQRLDVIKKFPDS